MRYVDKAHNKVPDTLIIIIVMIIIIPPKPTIILRGKLDLERNMGENFLHILPMVVAR